jgi:glycosyltransferase involved in cell wall biosynthesis
LILTLEADFADTVLIFQRQFFNTSGAECYNGGAERYCRDMAAVLAEAGYSVVLVQRGDGKKVWRRKVGCLEVVGLPVRNEPEYVRVCGLFRKFRFAVYSGYLPWGSKIHPNILISHGITWDAPDSRLLLPGIYDIIRDVDEFVSVDTNTISWLRTAFREKQAGMKMHYIPNFVDTNLYKPGKHANGDRVRIVFPRRASPERGFWLVAAILPEIMRMYPKTDFDFVGFAHGKMVGDEIEKLTGQFLGRIRHYVVGPDEMPAVYQGANISLIPTIYSEGTSLSCLEAMACGNVVISTNIGGLPNLIIDGYNGLLINPDAHALSAALARVLASPDLCGQLSRNAVFVAKAFDKKFWINRWKPVLDAIENE